MAETIVSPGVLAIENDQSFITQGPIQAGAAIIGPTVKGRVGIPTLCTTYSDYSNKFGTTFLSGSQTYSYFTSISAYNYFNSGGTSLLVTRVVSGSFTPATSSNIPDSGSLNNVFVLETLSEGEMMNSSGSLYSDGTLQNGTADNYRWQIVSPNINNGTFTLLIRQGNDSTNSPSILETWSNLSLDPFATNYIEKVIGNQYETVQSDPSTGDYYIQTNGAYSNQSRYVRVKQVNLTTPNYFDNTGNPKTQYTSSIPITSSGVFGGATGKNIPTNTAGEYYENITNTNIQGLPAAAYTESISLLSNQDAYNFNLITTPGLIADGTNYPAHISVISQLISTVQSRGDAMTVIDLVGYNSNIVPVTTNAITYDTSYAAAYWPWVLTIDPNSGQQVWAPASTMIPGVYAFNDNIAEPWFAPAGVNRGVMTTVVRAERNLTQANRDLLYESNVNSIATFPNTGVTVFGQKTLQKKRSALDRVNVRRLLIELKNYISQVADTLVFEQNTVATRNNFLSQVNPYLSSVQQRQGLTAFRVVMDESNNTPEVIDNNQLVGQIYLQPTRTAEFIILDFNILPTGATFPT
jgi:phage tail sheath protein FI